jgi:hypothetical protein
MPAWEPGHGVDRRLLGVRFLLPPPSLPVQREGALRRVCRPRLSGPYWYGADGLYMRRNVEKVKDSKG